MSDTKQKLVICPYCGHTQKSAERCESCGGFFEPLSRVATQIAMGPWFIRDAKQPFRPGCSFEVLEKQIKAKRIKPTTVMRGPTTKQFWTIARNVPGVAHLLGYCDMCGAHVKPNEPDCADCGQSFITWESRNELGLQFPDEDQVHKAQRYLDLKISEQTGESKKPTKDSSAPIPASSATAVPSQKKPADLLSEVIGQTNVADGEDAIAEESFEAGSDLLSFERTLDDSDPAAALAAATGYSESTRPAPPLPPKSSNLGLILILVISNVIMIGAVVAFAVFMMDGDDESANTSANPPANPQPANNSTDPPNTSSTNTPDTRQEMNAPDASSVNSNNPVTEESGKATFDPTAELPPLLEDAKRLQQDGQLEEALAKLEQYMAQTPEDRRFVGVEKVIADLKNDIEHMKRTEGIDSILDPDG